MRREHRVKRKRRGREQVSGTRSFSVINQQLRTSRFSKIHIQDRVCTEGTFFKDVTDEQTFREEAIGHCDRRRHGREPTRTNLATSSESFENSAPKSDHLKKCEKTKTFFVNNSENCSRTSVKSLYNSAKWALTCEISFWYRRNLDGVERLTILTKWWWIQLL